MSTKKTQLSHKAVERFMLEKLEELRAETGATYVSLSLNVTNEREIEWRAYTHEGGVHHCKADLDDAISAAVHATPSLTH